ncbi:helix-turn-helix domain-containing protein [Actinoplanes sp. NEAU-A12]|uniref:Helix-turn-helix domain-containing protein n=1 Tax=Actinoplanes sandaracinus TaxID=3045177 RepID=A0ABT6WGB1_9ACTN|nr:helix-turn-helix domain-containing protein [Actinoplanes sandaracinus]MDI6098752.1 helix-turn-helix domain-containing protein [Actinoplanes sandaracinus]
MTMRDATIFTGSTGRTLAATAELLHADILGSTEEMVREIQDRIPGYASTADEQEARMLRWGVDLALRRYTELLDQHIHPRAHDTRGKAADWREIYRTVGANEMRAGRSLDALHAAVRICARVANRRLGALRERHALPPDAVAWLAEAIFDNADEIAEATAEGYAQAQATEAGELARRRRRLLDLLIADPAPSERALAAAATAAGWRMPRRVAAVAVAAGSPAQPPMLPPEILAAFDHVPPCLIVPDPDGRARVRALVNGLGGHHAAVGLPVAPADAGKSLRWARLALDLAARKRIPRDRVIWCGDHLATLVLFQDEALLAALAERRLAPLATLREDKRRLLAETLLAWLTLNMNANAVAAHLHVHPQTVRHRLRALTDLFGAQLRDPRLRLELEIALRSLDSSR